MAVAPELGARKKEPAKNFSSEYSDGLEYSDEYSRFLIIGGGIAGLSAASHLANNGIHDFKLLEARNRLGGRIITVQIAGNKAELGANWIHGVLGNPLYELAVSKGLVDIIQTPKPHNVVATTEDGRRLPFSILQEIYEAYFWFFKRCEEYFLCKYQPPDGINSVGQHIELEINIYLQRFPPQQRHIRRLVFDYLLKRECCITGCDTMTEVDLMSLGSYTELPGGNIRLPRGYTSILGPIVSGIHESCILKGHPVKHIHWRYRAEMEEVKNDKGYESDGGESDSSVKTVKSNKSTASSSKSAKANTSNLPLADSIVLDAPLQTNSPKASSLNSSNQSSRCTSVSSSVCNTPRHLRSHPNVMIECENGKKFYTDHVICTIPLGVLQSKCDSIFVPHLPPEKKTAINKLNFGTVNKIFLDFEFPFLSTEISEVILLWDRIDEKSVPIADRWFRKIYSFAKVSETLLLGWIAGEEAKYMETLKMNVVAEVCTKILQKFLNDPLIPKPKSCIFTAWHSQPYSMGSYSSIGVGGHQSHIEKLAEPLFQNPNHRTPVVMFAGEHCHPSFYSTGHGAYLSGRSAGQYVMAVSSMARAKEEEEVYNLGAASVADLSTWLQEISMGEKNLEDYKRNRGRRDDGKLQTPR